jgi:hypothetical protein
VTPSPSFRAVPKPASSKEADTEARNHFSMEGTNETA